jgi:hypothetical protein
MTVPSVTSTTLPASLSERPRQSIVEGDIGARDATRGRRGTGGALDGVR